MLGELKLPHTKKINIESVQHCSIWMANTKYFTFCEKKNKEAKSIFLKKITETGVVFCKNLKLWHYIHLQKITVSLPVEDVHQTVHMHFSLVECVCLSFSLIIFQNNWRIFAKRIIWLRRRFWMRLCKQKEFQEAELINF